MPPINPQMLQQLEGSGIQANPSIDPINALVTALTGGGNLLGRLGQAGLEALGEVGSQFTPGGIDPLAAMQLARSITPKLMQGVFRQIGMQRAGGLLNPAEYLQRLQEQPNYQRYRELVQNMVRRGLGEQFPVARGKEQTDPLIRALLAGQSGAALPATAVTHAGTVPGATGFSTNMPSQGLQDIAEQFAQGAAEKFRKPSYVAQGIATPADVAALVPRRQAYGHEAELLLNPTESFAPQLTAKYIPPSSGFPFVERKPLTPDLTVDQILQGLAAAAKPPSP